MLSIQEFVQPKTIEEAYSILVKRQNNAILGGCAFLRLGSRKIETAVDLSLLDLNYLKAQGEYIEIGAQTTFRELETSALLADNFNNILARAVESIIGVQLRNIVTVGASVYSKYGFSNLITALSVLETEVELHKAGRMSLTEFLDMPNNNRDILTRIFIKKDERRASYQDLRKSASDFAILNAAVSKYNNHWTIAVGARPQRAVIAQQASRELSAWSSVAANLNAVSKPEVNPQGDFNIEQVAQLAAREVAFGTNTRGSASYRQEMCRVLVKRAIREVLACS
ncbi:FAD binding domain-containing protein [Desulfitibacter alkalitolerans]|uniref:FAD binding domain-containing protein n=1 Tax=Desulfitibacter alkalitolerans TaxID=264641 RepID=UPI000487584A|nr:FAD binding domain-containing protein [Desulfitibacter alkalitolerans]